MPQPKAEKWVRTAISSFAIALLALGLFGRLSGNWTLSATGLFLYALVGFGSAIMMSLGRRGWSLVTLGPALSVGLVLGVGVLLVDTGIWAIGLVLFWAIVAVTACVHLGVLQIERDRRRRPSTLSAGPAVETESSPRWMGFAVGGLTVIGLLLCLSSALRIRHLDPGMGGLLGAISPAWYVGLGVMVIAIVIGQKGTSLLAGLPVVMLQVTMAGTTAIVFDDPRYAWTGKQIGVTSYMLLHGSTNTSIDIYQAWPGLFSGVAWLLRSSHLASPVGVARFWPLVIDLATVLVVYELAHRVLRDPRRAWLAASLFVLGYTINDSDYFSPQSAAYLMSIAIFAVVFRHRGDRSRMTRVDWVILTVLSVAVAVTHQLSPYMITLALFVLVVFKMARSDWAPAITLAPAVAWALVNFSYVRSNVSLTGFLHFLSNFLTPGIASGGPSPGELANVVRYCQGGSALLLGFVALGALARYRTRLNVVLALCAASGGALLVANAYGNEAAFRVVLFALPWLVVLASNFDFRLRFLSMGFWLITLLAMTATYLVADMGLDYVYALRPGDLAALQKFEDSAPVGSTLIIVGYYASEPVMSTGRYNVVNEETYSNVLGFTKSSAQSGAVSFAQFMSKMGTTRGAITSQSPNSTPSYYVLTGQEAAAGLVAYNYATLKQYQAFAAQFSTSPLWETVLQTSTARLYRLRPWPKA